MIVKELLSFKIWSIQRLVVQVLGSSCTLSIFCCCINVTVCLVYMVVGLMEKGFIPMFLLLVVLMMALVCGAAQTFTSAVSALMPSCISDLQLYYQSIRKHTAHKIKCSRHSLFQCHTRSPTTQYCTLTFLAYSNPCRIAQRYVGLLYAPHFEG